MSLYLVEGKDEVLRRRALVPTGQVVEAWADHGHPGAFWLGEESKRLLDAIDPPLPAVLTCGLGTLVPTRDTVNPPLGGCQ